MVRYPIEQPTAKTPVVFETFLGVDFAKTPATTSQQYSPYSINMIRDEVGKVRKRTGYAEQWDYSSAVIHAIHKYNDDYIVHAGTALYKEHWSGSAWTRTTLKASGMNAAKSVSYQREQVLYILDGAEIYSYDGTTCAAVVGYIPTIIIAGDPAGGGTPYEDVNILSTKWTQRFTNAANDGSTYSKVQLAFDGLDATLVTVRLAIKSGGVYSWLDRTEGEATYPKITANHTTGVVTIQYTDTEKFSLETAEPLFGDKIYVTASKARSRDRITKCSVMTTYGYNGNNNQLFVAGNSTTEYQNRQYYSAVNDFTYFPDLGFSVLGSGNSAIMGFSKINGYLATHKDKTDGDIYLQTYAIDNTDETLTVYFPVQSVLKGSGAISKYSFQNFGEPLFLTKYGIQTITTRDMTNREYEQTRGDRINKRLLAEANPQNAVSCIYKDFYLIAINGHVYILDRLQRQYEQNAGNSEFQYSGFYWTGISANCLFADDYLYFGTTSGKVYKFYSDETAAASYADGASEIDAIWEFPEFTGRLFWENKNIRNLFLKLKTAIATGASIDIYSGGEWVTLIEDFSSTGYIDYRDKVHITKLDKVALRVRNNVINQPFSVDSFGFIFTEKGINKGDS